MSRASSLANVTMSSTATVAVTTPVVASFNKFAVATLIVPLLTVRFWSVIAILPFVSFVSRVLNAASSPVVIVAPESNEKTVVVPPVAVFAWVIESFKSANDIDAPLTATVARLWNDVEVKLLEVLFPAVNNVLISLMLAEAKEVTFVASIFPVV